MLALWLALAVTVAVFCVTIADVVVVRWMVRRSRSAAGVGLASEYHMSGDRLRPRLP